MLCQQIICQVDRVVENKFTITVDRHYYLTYLYLPRELIKIWNYNNSAYILIENYNDILI